MSHKKLRLFIVKVSVLGYFPYIIIMKLLGLIFLKIDVYTIFMREAIVRVLC